MKLIGDDVFGAMCSLVVLLAGCAHSKGATTMPGNWDDRYLDRAVEESRTRPVVAVLPFEVSEGLRGRIDVRLGDMVTTSLLGSGRFDLVEREKMDRVLQEQKFKLTGLVDDSSRAAEVGKLAGAEAVVFGALTSASQQTLDKFAYQVIRTEVRIDARGADTTTGQVLFSESAVGSSEAKVVRAADGTLISGAVDTNAEFAKAAASATLQLGKRLAQRFPLMGVVISAGADGFVLDLGAAHGVAVSDTFVVFRPAERLRHPVTKEPLGWKKRVLGTVRARTVEQKTSAAEPLEGEGLAAVSSGDYVVLLTHD